MRGAPLGGGGDSARSPSPLPMELCPSRTPCSRLRGRSQRCRLCPTCCGDGRLPRQQLLGCPSSRPSVSLVRPASRMSLLQKHKSDFDRPSWSLSATDWAPLPQETACGPFRRMTASGHRGHAGPDSRVGGHCCRCRDQTKGRKQGKTPLHTAAWTRQAVPGKGQARAAQPRGHAPRGPLGGDVQAEAGKQERLSGPRGQQMRAS